MPDLPNLDLYVNLVTNTEQCWHMLLVPGYIEVGNKAVGVKSLINTGADVHLIYGSSIFYNLYFSVVDIYIQKQLTVSIYRLLDTLLYHSLIA